MGNQEEPGTYFKGTPESFFSYNFPFPVPSDFCTLEYW